MGIPLLNSERFLLPVNLSLVYLLLLSIHGNVNPVRLLMVPMLPILGTVAALVGMDEWTLLSGRCAGTRITPEELRQFPLTFVPNSCCTSRWGSQRCTSFHCIHPSYWHCSCQSWYYRLCWLCSPNRSPGPAFWGWRSCSSPGLHC